MKRSMLSLRFLAIITMLLLPACSVTALGAKQSANASRTPDAIVAAPTSTLAPTVQAMPSGENPLTALGSGFERVYEQVNPSVVNIHVVQEQQVSSPQMQLPGSPFLPFPGLPENQGPQYTQGLGSGFVWDKQGDIITNNHVIDGADKIDVTFSDGTTVPGEVIGADPNSDLAVVKVNLPEEKLQPVQLADSTQVKVGQIAIAIGNPFGLQETMTVGIISGLGRLLPVSEGDAAIGAGPTYSIPDIIQTDAPINPGNSGGVLVNDQGQVIGVTAAIESPTQASAGIGFVIPAAIVQRVVPTLIETGNYEHPYLGISGITLNPDLAKAMDLNTDQRGALVEEIVPNGPADKAGLHASERQVTINGQDIPVGGDLITAIDGQSINGIDDLIAYLNDNTEVGQSITLTVLRNGQQIDLSVTLEARPTETPVQESTQIAAWLGITGATLTPQIDNVMGLSTDQTGVLIQEVQPNSPADQAGLRGSFLSATINGQRVTVGGDVITALDGFSVTNMQDLVNLLSQAQPGREVSLTILRDGNQQEVKVTLGQMPG